MGYFLDQMFAGRNPVDIRLTSHTHASPHVCTTIPVVGSDYRQPGALSVHSGILGAVISYEFQ